MQTIRNFEKKYKLWNACAQHDDIHPVMEYIYFEDGNAYASDSHILVRVPLTHLSCLEKEENELLNGHGIHATAYKFLVGLGPLTIEKTEITTPKGKEEGVCLVGFMGDNRISIALTNPSQQKHPNFGAIFERDAKKIPISKIGISNEKLSRLTNAIGTTEIKMGFTEESKKIFVQPMNEIEDGVEGVVMPLMITGTFEGF